MASEFDDPEEPRDDESPPSETPESASPSDRPSRAPGSNKPAGDKKSKRKSPKRAESDGDTEIDETPHLELRNLTVTFGRQAVLRNVSLTIPRGQTVALIGESGCGKTVLMKSAIGLVRPTLGQVLFDGVDLATLDDKRRAVARVRFGFVFQNAALFDSMTIGQNVAFPLRQQGGASDDEVRRRVLDGLSEVGLPSSIVYKRPAELSGGQRKRVGLARALILGPEVMLYDEPTTGLDPIMSDVINELMLRTRRNHVVTSLIVTHDMRTARKVADRVVMVYPLSRLGPDDPQVIFDGHPSELDRCRDRRVLQFIHGEAGERLTELAEARLND